MAWPKVSVIIHKTIHQVEDAKEYPYNAIGQVRMVFDNDLHKPYFGTGTLITPNVVLTAAHNLYEVELKGLATYVSFQPAINGDDDPPFESINIEDMWVPDEYIEANNAHKTEEECAVYDYALILLSKDEPIETGICSMVDPYKLPPNLIASITGYPNDKDFDAEPHTMWTDRREVVLDLEKDLVYYEIDTVKGQSGSAVMNDEHKIFAVHDGGKENEQKNYGVLLKPAIQERIQKQIEIWSKLGD